MTPDEYIDANFPRSETLPTATLHCGDAVFKGRAVVENDINRGAFWPTDEAKPDLPISDAILHINGQKINIENVEKCPAQTSYHWHFSLKKKI